MGKLDNSLKLLSMLLSEELISSQELVNRLGVSDRQIRTYIEYLKMANIKIGSKSGVNGGYYINQPICPLCGQKLSQS